MNKFLIVFIGLFCFINYTACSDGYNKLDLILKTESGNILVFVKYADVEHEIVNHFYMIYEKTVNDFTPEKLAILENGVIKDKDGKIILDMSESDPKFYGFKITLSYPTNKLFSPGFNLDPYFGSFDNVGDTQRIQWDKTKRTFQKNLSILP